MIDIIKLLQENTEIKDYKINTVKTESYELFFVHEALETVRCTDTENTTVTVYSEHDGKIGHASFKLYASTTEDEARAKIDKAWKQAALISNEYYTLPENEMLDGEIPSNFAHYDAKTLAYKIQDAVFSADTLDFGSINALEIFVNKHTVSVKNSRGIDKCERKYSAMVEAIPTWNEGESVELYEAKRFNSFDFDDVKTEIEEKMREVRDRGRATPPAKKLSCPVMLGAHEIASLVRNIYGNLDYAAVYAHMNPYSIGDKVQKDLSGDPISITMRAQLEGSVASALFDGDGTSLCDTEIIRNGEVVSYFGSHRFAQYLKAEPTGALPCVELAVGTLSDNERAIAPYFECVSMSGLQVDILNDYIGGEVRLAYYFDGEKKIPMTGISISGKLSSALDSIRLSSEAKCAGSYKGPKYALLSGLEII